MSPWIGNGEWKRTGGRRFLLTVLVPRFDSNGSFVGLSDTRASLHLNQAFRKATGQFTADLLDPNGNVLVTEAGTVAGARIKVEPLTSKAGRQG